MNNTQDGIIIDGILYLSQKNQNTSKEVENRYEDVETAYEDVATIASKITSKWDEPETMLFIDLCVHKYQEKLRNPKFIKKEVFKDISHELALKGHKFTSLQCENKLKTLITKFKTIADHNASTGNFQKTWKYYDALEKYMGGKPNVKPRGKCSAIELSRQITQNPPSTSTRVRPAGTATEVCAAGTSTEVCAAGTSTSTEIHAAERSGEVSVGGTSREISAASTSTVKKRKRENSHPRDKMLKWLDSYSKDLTTKEKDRRDLLERQHTETSDLLKQILKKINNE